MDDAQDLLSVVRRRYDELTESQKRIAQAIVDDPEFVAFATVDKLSDRLSVAPSTVVRFAYRLGLHGYPELQARVRDVVRGHIRGNPADPAEDRSLAEHLGTHAPVVLGDLDDLRQTITSLEAIRLDEAIETLSRAGSVFVTGGGVASPLAWFTAYSLERIRDHVHLIERPEGLGWPALLEAGSSDTLLAVGLPPYPDETLRIADLARARGLTVIAISDAPLSPLGQRAGIALTARVEAHRSSLVTPAAVVDVLLDGVRAHRT